MENFIATLCYLAIGVALARTRQFPKEGPVVLNAYIIYVALPALVIREVPGLTFTPQLLLPAIMPWCLLALCAAAVLLISRLFHWERQITGTLLLLACLGNTAFLGIPVVEAFFGKEAVPYALIYDQLGSFLGLSTFGALVLAVYGPSEPDQKGHRPDISRVVRKIITFPPFVALVLAATLFSWIHLPDIAGAVISSLASTLVPVVMIAVGMQLKPRLEPGTFKPFVAGLVIKLVLSPIAALLITSALGRGDLIAKVTVLEAGMPPMVSAGAVAVMAGMSPRLVASLVGLGILVSFLTLPLLHQLLV